MPLFPSKKRKTAKKVLEIRGRLAFCDSKERKEGEDDAAQMDALNGRMPKPSPRREFCHLSLFSAQVARLFRHEIPLSWNCDKLPPRRRTIRPVNRF